MECRASTLQICRKVVCACLAKASDRYAHVEAKGAPAIECWTGTRLVSPRHGPKKKFLEASTTKVLNCHRTSYSLTVT